MIKLSFRKPTAQQRRQEVLKFARDQFKQLTRRNLAIPVKILEL